MHVTLKPGVPRYSGGRKSSQSQHYGSRPAGTAQAGRGRYKPDWHFSADQNLSEGRPMRKAQDVTPRKAAGSFEDNILFRRY